MIFVGSGDIFAAFATRIYGIFVELECCAFCRLIRLKEPNELKAILREM